MTSKEHFYLQETGVYFRLPSFVLQSRFQKRFLKKKKKSRIASSSEREELSIHRTQKGTPQLYHK